MIETGLEIIDAIANNPMEALVLSGMGIFAYKFFGDRERRHDIWWDLKSWLTIDVRYALPRLVNNKRYSFCGLKVEYLERVYQIIKTRYAFSRRQREIIHDETGLSYDDIEQIINALIKSGRIDYDGEHRLVTEERFGEILEIDFSLVEYHK